MATAKFEVAADLWPQVVSKPGEPLRVVEHHKGDVVDVDPDQYANLVDAGALVKQGSADKQRASRGRKNPDAELEAQRKARAAEGDQGGSPADNGSGDGPFDPSKNSVEDVKAYLDGLPEDEDGDAERERVLAAEKDGKNRSSLLGSGGSNT